MTTTNEPTEPMADARDMASAHAMFRREFSLMPGLIGDVTAGDTERAALVADHAALIITILEHHHAGEDQYVWPNLRMRCPEEYAPLVDIMESQHDAVHDSLLHVNQSLAMWRDAASAAARDELADTVKLLLPLLAEHLALEEARVVPLIESYVTEAEYSRIAAGQVEHTPPDKLPLLFGMFMYEAPADVIDMVVTLMPPEAQPIIRDLATQTYAAYAKDLYGTSTPTRGTGN
jgi:hemerythrin-like domain-containing protein